MLCGNVSAGDELKIYLMKMKPPTRQNHAKPAQIMSDMSVLFLIQCGSKEVMGMDVQKQMNLAMSYIEANLGGEIDFQKAARLACCSEYHFKRMFSFLSGFTLSEYVRRRRLTLAALELHNCNVKIIDLAVKYGYDSPDSFTKAFQALHGVTPTEARK